MELCSPLVSWGDLAPASPLLLLPKSVLSVCTGPCSPAGTSQEAQMSSLRWNGWEVAELSKVGDPQEAKNLDKMKQMKDTGLSEGWAGFILQSVRMGRG